MTTETTASENATGTTEATAGDTTGSEATVQTTETTATEGQTQTQTEEQAAIEYADFSVPEGVMLDPDILGDFKTIAKEHGLNQEQAQAFADLGVKMSQKWAESQQAVIAKQSEDWAEQSRNDKEFGGEKFTENLAVIKKGRDALASPEILEIFEKTGLGNHPDVLRLFYKAGKQLSEDGFVSGSRQHTGEKTLEQKMYPNLD